MSELDDNLTSILNNAHKMNWRLDPLLAQIKQAFADAGYDRCVAMTGQEWYDRFIKEVSLEADDAELNAPQTREQIAIRLKKAAERASGLEETK